jgi:uncharacterized membrane protein
MAKMQTGQYAVISVLLLSLVTALINLGTLSVMVAALLAVIGLYIGFTQIRKQEAQEFMVVAVVLAVVSVSAWVWLPAGTEAIAGFLKTFVGGIAAAAVPAAVITAVGRWYTMSGKK